MSRKDKKIEDAMEGDIENNIERAIENKFERARRPHSVWKIFWGLFFLLAAVGVILTSFGVLTIGVNLFWIIVTVFLVAIIIKSLASLEWVGVFMPLAGIACIFREQIGSWLSVDPNNIWTVWPAAALLMISFYILFHRKRKFPRAFIHHGGGHHGENFDQVIDGEDGSEVSVSTSFGSVIKYINSQKLEKVNIDCSFGAVKVYFDNSKLGPDGAVCKLSISFGAAELYVPKEWRIDDSSNHSMSGVEEKNRTHNTDSKQVLRLVGDISLSGVTIIYV